MFRRVQEPNWQQVPIEACTEALESVTGDRLLAHSVYRERGYPNALDQVWLRATLCQRIAAASELLPDGCSFILLDGWRPVALQTTLYNQYRQDIAENTGLAGEALEEETQRFIKLPSIDANCPSPHITGGAVDLTLAKHGKALDMGGEYDELSDRSSTDFYEQRSDNEPYHTFRNRRRILCSVMTYVGFSNYPEEWWHFDMGNQLHHARVGGAARYGPIAELPDVMQ